MQNNWLSQSAPGIAAHPRAANEALPQRHFHVLVKHGARVVRSFEAMGTSRVAVQRQHEGLCEPGQYCWVQSAEERRAVEQHALNDRRALELQVQANRRNPHCAGAY